jgi:WD40 repeat protein
MTSGDRRKKLEILYGLDPNVIYISKEEKINNTLYLHLANPTDMPMVFKDVKSRIYAVALTEDGKNALSGSDDGAVKVWDLVRDKLLFEFREHQELVSSVAVTPDGSKAVSGSWDETVKVWDLKEQKMMFTLKGHFGWVNSVAISADGKMAISGSADRTVKVWDLIHGHCIKTLCHSGPIQAVALTEDGKTAVSGSQDGMLRVWNLDTGNYRELRSQSVGLWALAVTPDGNNAVLGYKDGTLKVWNLNKVSYKELEGHTAGVTAVAVTTDGKRVVSGSEDRTLKVWNIDKQKMLYALEHQSGVLAVAVALNGQKVVSSSIDGKLKIWDRNQPQEPLHSFATDHTYGIAVTPDGKIVLGYEDKIEIRDWTTAKLDIFQDGYVKNINVIAVTTESNIVSKSFDPNTGNSQDFIINIYGLKGNLLNRIYPFWLTKANPIFMDITPGGKKAVMLTNNNNINILDLEPFRGKLIKSLPVDDYRKICHLKSTPNCNQVVTWDSEKKLKVCNCQGINLAEMAVESVTCLDVTPDGRQVVIGNDNGEITVFNMEQGHLLDIMHKWKGHNESITIVKVGPNGQKVISSSLDNTLKIWDLETGEMLMDLKGHRDTIVDVAFISDNKIVSGSLDKSLKIWNIAGCSFRDIGDSSAKEGNAIDQNLHDYPYNLSKFYIWFNLDDESSQKAGALTTKELAKDITISEEGEKWFCENASDPKIGPYWILYPKRHMILEPKECVTFKINGIICKKAQSKTPPGMTWINIRYHIGNEYETHRIAIILKE